MIKPYPEYDRLYQVRKYYLNDLSRAVDKFSDQEYLDLTVLANLVWIDPGFRNDPRIKALYGKKRNFSIEEREELLKYQKQILKQVLPKLKEVQDRGQIEVSFSPFYHPILPLLIDTDLAKEAMPRVRLPKNRFMHPEDAQAQVRRSVDMYSDLFGRKLRGMWPSEGSVAEKLLPILADCGIEWIATDEEIFFQSINHAKAKGQSSSTTLDFHQPFMLERSFGDMGIIFRDHKLSDRIGFVYSSWDADRAAADFLSHLASIRALLKPSEIEDHVVPIILDGENAWEYFDKDGIDFLNALYDGLSNDNRFETVTVSELFERTGMHKNIPYLFAGSWIGHNFKIWIGHEEDNRAWDLLWSARRALVEFQKKNPDADKAKMAQAWEEIYIAEGSDWCWWYGDDHSSQEDDMFDIIFRSHLSAVYSLIGQDPPQSLLRPVRSTVSQSAVIQPSNFISATIDGEVTHFYEWYDAGSFNCRKASSTMHRADNVVEEIFFGFDKYNLYFRLDPFMAARDEDISDFEFELDIRAFKMYRLIVSSDRTDFSSKNEEEEEYSQIEFKGRAVLKKCAEISIPRDEIEMNEDFEIHLRIRVFKSGQLIETWPSMDLIKYQAPTEDHSIFWQV